MKRWVALSLALVVLTTMGASCGRTPGQALLVSEATLSLTGQEFVNASTEITERCKPTAPRRLDPKTCNGFADFSLKFKPAFAYATELWKIGRRTNDAGVQKGAEAAITSLALQLAPFTAAVAASYVTK